jgi:hypothetical protein
MRANWFGLVATNGKRPVSNTKSKTPSVQTSAARRLKDLSTRITSGGKNAGQILDMGFCMVSSVNEVATWMLRKWRTRIRLLKSRSLIEIETLILKSRHKFFCQFKPLACVSQWAVCLDMPLWIAQPTDLRDLVREAVSAVGHSFK